MATMSPRLQILLPEYRAEPGDRLTPWVLLSALLIGSGLVLLLWHRPSLKLITKTGYPTQHTFQILPEPLQGGRAVPTARPHSTPAIRPTRPSRTFSHPGGYPSVRPQVVVPTTPMVPGSTRKATRQRSHETDGASPRQLNLAQLEDQMDQVARGAAASPALPRFQNPHSLAAQEYIAAWIQKTERIGDLNYPGDMTGQLEIRVALNADGSLESVRIVHSSGNSALDRAALRVVRLSAPYAPFSRELLQVTHHLVIRCGMNFLGEKHLSARF